MTSHHGEGQSQVLASTGPSLFNACRPPVSSPPQAADRQENEPLEASRLIPGVHEPHDQRINSCSMVKEELPIGVGHVWQNLIILS